MNNVQILTGIIPDHIIKALSPAFLLKAGIDGPKRLSHFLGQLMEESGNFTKLVENLHYSGERLWKTFPKHFKDADEAMTFNNQPEAIANRIYDRQDLGNTSPGDGWKYRGRGPVQLTGKDNYQGFQDWVNKNNTNPVDIINNPDLLSTDISLGLLSAVWLFAVAKNLWPVCDQGVGLETVKEVTRKVNGGENGLQDRYDHTTAIFTALTV